jgi:hypothetical protein
MDDEGLADVRPAYQRLRSRVIETDTALANLTRDRARLQELIEGLEELYPGLAGEGDQGDVSAPVSKPVSEQSAGGLPEDFIPRGKQAVIMILSKNAGQWFTAQQVLAELGKHGWAPRSESGEHALRAVRTAIGRAVDAGDVKSKPLDGRTLAYQYPIDPQRDVIPAEGGPTPSPEAGPGELMSTAPQGSQPESGASLLGDLQTPHMGT